MEKPKSEPMLTFRLSEGNEFRCSACGHAVVQLGNARFVVSGIPDLIAAFKEHVGRVHTKEDARQAAARIVREATDEK
jgi:hypothetical protein